MPSRKSGFTLIEMLVAITVVDIVIGIALMTFRPYLQSSRDATRHSATQTMTLLVRMKGMEDLTDQRFRFNENDLLALFADNRFRTPRSFRNICLFFAGGSGALPSLEDNEFVFASWEEKTGKVIARGTQKIVDAFLASPLQVTDFSCTENFSTLQTLFLQSVGGGEADFLFLDEEGRVRAIINDQ